MSTAPLRTPAPGPRTAPRTASPRTAPRTAGPRTGAPERAGRPTRGSLALLPPAASRRGRAPFALVVVALLGAGLIALLLLNTVLAQNAFRVHDLQVSTARLADEESELGEQVANGVSPVVLAQQATALGMVPGGVPSFRRLADGRLLGVVTAAPLPVQPAPSASTNTSASASTGASPSAGTTQPSPGTASGSAAPSPQPTSTGGTR